MKMSRKATNQRNRLIDDLLNKCLDYSTRNEINQDALIQEFIELNSIADNIREIEKGLIVKHNRENHLNEFIAWLELNGIILDGFSINCVDKSTNEFGLFANKEIKEDSLVLKIPKRLMMTTETAIKDSSLKSAAMEDALLKSMPNILLAFHLMDEYCRPDSFWRPYILFCPSSYTTPLYFTKEDLMLLKGSPVLAEVVKLSRNIYRQYAYFWKKMSTKSSPLSKLNGLKAGYSLELYRWAISTVMTRQNQIPNDKNKTLTSHNNNLEKHDCGNDNCLQLSLSALIPLWDLCNHYEGKVSTNYDPESSTLLCYAMKDFAVDEEITIFYGKRSNAELLVNNGFVFLDNKHDFLAIRLGLSKVDPLYELRAKLCLRTGLISSGYYPLHHKNIGLDNSLVNFLKIFLIDKDLLEKLLENEKLSQSSFIDISEELEKKVIDFIKIRCQILLKSYPSLDYLDDKILSTIESNIIKLVACEKNILSSYTEV